MSTTLFIHIPDVIFNSRAAVEALPGVTAALNRFRLRGVQIIGLGESWDIADDADAAALTTQLLSVLGSSAEAMRGILWRTTSSPLSWRSPRPGMLLAAFRQFQCDLPSAWVIGTHADHARAAAQAGCAGAVIVAGGALPEEELGIVVAAAHDLADAPRVMIPRQGGCWHQ